MNFSFPKSEKLKSKKAIKLLFAEGNTVTKYPIKLFYLPIKSSHKTKAAFSVPKHNFKKAVTRNRIKRQLREAYRHQKHLLKNDGNLKYLLFFLYIGKENSAYTTIDTCLINVLKKMKK
jgi:ribonuclease P protein component